MSVSTPKTPATPPAPQPDACGVVACVAYADGKRVGEVAIEDISEVIQKPGQFVWIGLYEPSEKLLEEVQAEFGLHDLAIEDAHNAHQRPKLERYADSLFAVLHPAQLNAGGRVEFGETHVFLGRNYVVTVRHGSLRSHLGVRASCEAQPELLALGPGFVFYSLMDFVVDHYVPIVEAYEMELDAVESAIFDGGTTRDTTSRIYELKRDLLSLKRAVSPLVDMADRLTKENELIPADARPYFRDVYDHALRTTDQIDDLLELLATALNANLALIAVAQNEQMKRLAAWAAIIAVPTMVAGIYGMNFKHMPELGWIWGYPAALAIMGGACLGLFTLFKRSGWL